MEAHWHSAIAEPNVTDENDICLIDECPFDQNVNLYLTTCNCRVDCLQAPWAKGRVLIKASKSHRNQAPLSSFYDTSPGLKGRSVVQFDIRQLQVRACPYG